MVLCEERQLVALITLLCVPQNINKQHRLEQRSLLTQGNVNLKMSLVQNPSCLSTQDKGRVHNFSALSEPHGPELLFGMHL